MRILLAGSSPTLECLKLEIETYRNQNYAVVANLNPLSDTEKHNAREHYNARSSVSLVDFNPDDADELLGILLEECLGFDVLIYPPHLLGFTHGVLDKLCKDQSIGRRLQIIGCPNASLEAFKELLPLIQTYGIKLVNIPNIHARSVAEYTLCQLGFHSRQLSLLYEETGTSDAWPHQEAIPITRSLEGKNIGIFGASGRDGYAVAELAKKMGVNVICPKPRTMDGELRLLQLKVEFVSIDELLQTSDFLSINCKNSESVHGMIATQQISMMKPGVIIINPAGAEIFDRNALLFEFEKSPSNRCIGTLVLDMPYGGKRDKDAFRADAINKALKERGVLFTPRIAGYSLDSRMSAIIQLADAVSAHRIADNNTYTSNLGTALETDVLTDNFLERIIEIIQNADKEAIELRAAGLDIVYKEDGSPATNADIKVENRIRDGLTALKLDYQFCGEELVDEANETSKYKVVVDGIDGTRNFRDGNYGWCTSFAVFHKSRIVLAIINDPTTEETYYARIGRGSFVRNRTSERKITIPHAMPTDFSFSIGSFYVAKSREIRRRISEDIKRLGGREREWGCVGLSICAVARGGLGAFIQYNSPSHDHAAAVLIAQEAGAITNVSTMSSSGRADVLVCHPNINERIVAVATAQVAAQASLG